MTKKKPWWVKLLISLLSLVLVVAIAIGGVYFYAKSKFGIDIFQTISQLKIMAQDVDEATMFTNKFTEEDMKTLAQEKGEKIINHKLAKEKSEARNKVLKDEMSLYTQLIGSYAIGYAVGYAAVKLIKKVLKK